MDVSLFDGVRDRRPLEERECFYSLLRAASAAKPRQIEREAAEELARRRDYYERLARNRHQRPEDRAAAQRALERAQAGADDVVPLFNDPASQRGKLFVLRGEALRAVAVRIDDPEIAPRIDHYYEVEIVTPDSQNNPIVCCVADLPDNMPRGETIHANVRVVGFFLKSYAYQSRQSAALAASEGKINQQLAPLLVAATLEVLPPPALGPRNTMLTLAVAIAILLGGAAIWYAQWGDRRARRRVQQSDSSLPARLAIDEQDLSRRAGEV